MKDAITVATLTIILGLGLSAASAQSRPPSDYTIGPQDVLAITVFNEPDLSGKFRVGNDGTFEFPFIGKVTAAGRTVRQVEEEITRRLRDGFVRQPQVSTEVETYRSRSIVVTGEVRSPAKYPLTGDMTLIEALAQAGGTTPAASNEVTIVRPKHPDGSTPAAPGDTADAQKITVLLSDLQSGQLSQNITLQDGDTIFVPRAEKFFVTGRVRTPGQYVWERGMTVEQALSLAGGIDDRGSRGRVTVRRVVAGRTKEFRVKLTDLVEAGDTINVPQRFF